MRLIASSNNTSFLRPRPHRGAGLLSFIKMLYESTVLLCMAYKIDDGPTKIWKPGDTPPVSLFQVVSEGGEIHAHNSIFEQRMWREQCVNKLGWPSIPLAQWVCSMASCSRLALPRSLEAAGSAMGLSMAKDKEGHKVMMRLCKPLPENQRKGDSMYDNDPEKFQRLYDYCIRDVDSQYELVQSLEPLSPGERKVWLLDQEINERGVPIDIDAVNAALIVVEQLTERNRRELADLTDGQVMSANQVAAMRKWLLDNGLDLPDRHGT